MDRESFSLRDPVERLIEDGFAGRVEPGSADFEQFVVTARGPSGEFSAMLRTAGFSEISVDEQQNEQRVRAVALRFSS